MNGPRCLVSANSSRRTLWKALALAVALAVPGPAAGEDPPDPVLVSAGEGSYRAHCGACHGVGGRGDGPVAPVLRIPPPDLTRIAARRDGVFPEADIADYIDGRAEVDAHGPRDMPVWGRVFARPVVERSTGEEVARGQLWVLVEYLRSIQVEAPPGAEAEPSAP